MRRMLGLGWRYRWGCIRLLVLQALLLCTALSCLGLTGYGIDLIRHFVAPTADAPASNPIATPAEDWRTNPVIRPPTKLPFGLPPDHWPPMAQVALIAGIILALELTRGVLNYTYALSRFTTSCSGCRSTFSMRTQPARSSTA
jgi:ATP-binding cassette subfamily B protein